jgi:nucleoside-triphosphatase THEP1
MSSSDDANQTTGSVERNERPYNHREFLNERRRNILHQKQTDHLPSIDSEPLRGRIAWRQLIQLRVENKRLRWELVEASKDIETVQCNHQQEIGYYQTQLQNALASRDSLQAEHNELELRYQELYHAFQSAVEEKATKIVDEAARTIELGSEDLPAQVNDVMKTAKLRVRQVEDKSTAEALYLMRQTQRKVNRLEHELMQEREQLALERQKLYNLQNSAREQAELRKRIVEQRLRAQYTLSLVLITTVLLILLPLMQITLFTLLHIQLTQLVVVLLFAPLIICALLAGLFAQLRAITRTLGSGAPRKKCKKDK